ncbi:hypothetical protein KEM56_000097 [Ascosphaera pollenicola]|nr:hypothetical protein KEM56_000097 [Ascosphaera pollenicola]
MGYRIVEPHPSAPKAAAIHTSRGGAGNICSLKNTTTTPGPTAQGPPSLTRLDSRTPGRRFMGGRGGAGNVHTAYEQRPIFSFDEELELVARREQSNRRGAAPVFTAVGRGGAGNLVSPPERAEQLRDSYLQHQRKTEEGSGVGRTSSGSEAEDAALARLQSNSSSASSVVSRTSSVADSVKRATKRGLSKMFSH